MTHNKRDKEVMRELLRHHGQTYAAEAHIQLKNTTQPLYRTLVLAYLLSARSVLLRLVLCAEPGTRSRQHQTSFPSAGVPACHTSPPRKGEIRE
ncbi:MULTISPECIES: hypothetical protein [unclassified Streptomyces]|uniref:hypothetical protein n=1 Tax=unclassified Streptomyces TaxID=2593676 RepID=UPI00379F22AD